MNRLVARTLLKTMRSGRVRHLRELEQIQWRSPESLDELNRSRLADLLRHACANIPHYRKFCSQAGIDPASVHVGDLASFPLITKREMIDNQVEFIDSSVPASARIANSTGGSSGIPFKFFNDPRAMENRTANDLLSRTWTRWRLGDPQALLWGHRRDNQTTGSFRGRFLAKYVHRSLTLNTFELTAGEVADFHARLQSFSPRLLLGYSSALNYFANYCREKGLEIPTLRGIISSAETLMPEYRENIENVFPVQLFNRYGSREFGVIAQQCEVLEGMHVFTDQIHVEILNSEGLPCQPGELGEIVITDLTNRVMPFIRFRTGDVARPQSGTCGCGRGFPLLEAVEGRTSELIVGKNGKLISCPGPRFYGAGIPGIHQMQLVQNSIDELVVNIVPDKEWSDGGKELLVARMRDLLGDIQVTIHLTDDIPPLPSGKFPFSISKVSPFQ